jgi:hypothetical protein
MMTPADIAEYGERHVSTYLASTGYNCHASRPHHGASDIEARGEEENLFVHVMAALAPSPVPDLGTSDLARVLSRAMTLGYDAWLAKVQVGPHGDLVGDIEWSQLNH